MKYVQRLVGSAVAAASLVALLAASGASAATFPQAGRGEFNGYYTNINQTCGDKVIPSGIGYNASTRTVRTIDAADFINFMRSQLFVDTGQDRTGASFIINTMLGRSGPSFGGSRNAGVVYAQDHFDQWAKIVNAYEDRVAGASVNWGNTTRTTFPTNSLNSMYLGRADCSSGGGALTGIEDDAFYEDSVIDSEYTIRFRHPNGRYYNIKRNCGNPVGDVTPFPLATFYYDLDSNVSGAGLTGPLFPGQTYTLKARIWNRAGALPSDEPTALYVGIHDPLDPVDSETIGRNYITNMGMDPGGGRVYNSAHGSGAGCPSVTAPSLCDARRWGWFYHALDRAGGPIDESTTDTAFTFRIDNDFPITERLCFTAFATPDNNGAADPGNTLCYEVGTRALPSVEALSGDVHAGGGICDQTLESPDTGVVRGYPGAGSYGDYVVSASAANGINNFRSNGLPGALPGYSGDDLATGETGDYAQICRDDLVGEAIKYRTSGQPYNFTLASDFDVTGKSGIWYLDSPTGNTTIFGTVNGNLTLVSRVGSVRIRGNLTLSSGLYARADQPALGIISNGVVSINAGVTRVDAYIFSNATIDTCFERSTVCATSVLVVNGSFTAKAIALRRLGAPNTNTAVPAERIILNPQVYLNPPPLFENLDDALLESVGEGSPLF